MKILLALTLAAAPLPAYEQTPSPGWDRGNSFAKDVCTERDELRSDGACYAAYLRSLRQSDPTLSFRCTIAYQRWTHWEFYGDDRPNCPNLRRPRR